jgi:hypothetical protein
VFNAAKVGLYQVGKLGVQPARTVQADARVTSLNSNNVFLLVTPPEVRPACGALRAASHIVSPSALLCVVGRVVSCRWSWRVSCVQSASNFLWCGACATEEEKAIARYHPSALSSFALLAPFDQRAWPRNREVMVKMGAWRQSGGGASKPVQEIQEGDEPGTHLAHHLPPIHPSAHRFVVRRVLEIPRGRGQQGQKVPPAQTVRTSTSNLGPASPIL